MTALCPGGGPSGPIPGTDSRIAFGAAAIEAAAKRVLKADIGDWIGVLASLGAVITDTYCTGDPPADPHLTQTDWDNALSPPNPIAYALAVGRIKDWFLNWYWWEVCECTGGVTPPPPTPSTPPGTGSNTGLPSSSTATPCWTASTSVTVPPPDFNTSFVTTLDITPALFDTAWQAQPPPAPAWVKSVLGSTFVAPVQWSVTTTIDALPVNGSVDSNLLTSISGGTVNSTGLSSWSSPSSDPLTKTFTTSQTNLGLTPGRGIFVANSDHATRSFTVQLQLWCTNPFNPNTDCCPPDPIVEFYLQQILTLVQNLYTSPTSAPSTSWTPGTAHASISGTGSFNIARGVTAVRAQFTTIPSAIRVTPGTPTFYWDLGFVTPLAMTYPLRSLRTVFATQDIPLPIQSDAVAYTFPPGVVVTLIELLPA